MVQARVPKQVLLDGAQMNLMAFLAGTMGFLKKRKVPLSDWTSYIAKQFEDSWGDLEGRGADEVMGHLLALQVRSLGTQVRSSKATPAKAEVTLTPLPSRTLLEKFGTTPTEFTRGFGVTRREFASLYAIYEPAAQAIGLRFTHGLKGRLQVIALERTAGARKGSGQPRFGIGARA